MTATSLPAQLVRTACFTRGVPDRFTVTADGTAVLFLRSRAGDDLATCLWVLDLGSGAERLLADPVALRERESGITGYATDAAATLATFALGGELWAVNVADGAARPLPTPRPVSNPRPDPSGARVAYVHAGALRVIEADGSDDRALASPDDPDSTFGTGTHTGTTSLDGHRGYWWAPDGDRLLVALADFRDVPLWYLADPTNPSMPPRAVRYPAVGRANPRVTLWVVGLDGVRTQVRWDVRAFEYVVGAGWDAHGPYAVVQSRDQRTVRFLGVDPATGHTTLLDEQRDDSWVQLVPGLPARTGSGALLRHVDQVGTRRLTVDGTVVTPPGLQLRAVLGVDGEEVLFTASEEPTQTHLWSFRATTGVRRLSAAGNHSAVHRNGTLVRVTRRADRPGGRATVLRAEASPRHVASLAERPTLDLHVRELVLGPRELRARLYLPSWHHPGGGRLPVLLDPYGGAGRQQVTTGFDWRCLVSQWFAEQGFAVLVADGAGTPGRGPAWEREVHGDLFGPVLDDQVTAVAEATHHHPELDAGRVGIRGWSFGGSLAALAVLRRPDVFHAAVAGAGVTDQLLYNTHWRERFLGHPDDFPERYEACSLVRLAPNLARPLLLIHGLDDDNVHPANTLRLSAALLAAGRAHEVLLLPGVGHNPIGGQATENLLRHQAAFLRWHLGDGALRTRTGGGQTGPERTSST